MKLNEDKCHHILFGASKERDSTHIGEAQVKESEEQKLLGITVDKKLSFKKHVQTLCKKFSQKFHALARISICMEPDKLKLLMKTFRYAPV